MRKASLFSGSIAALALLGSSSPASAATDCDRACLNGFVDQYLTALVAHDPKRLPLAANVRYTENGQVMELGDGMWGVASGAGASKSKIYFNDPQLGQVGFMGVMEEAGNPVILYLRLKVAERKIAEVEALVVRKEQIEFNRPQDLHDKPIFSAVLPPAERRSRKQMTDVLNAYFEAQIKAQYNDAIFDPDCQRVENGNVTANNPDGDKMGKLSCGDQVKTGVSALLTRAREPRFFVVDEERGLVGTVFFFDHSATVRSVKLHFPDGTSGERTSSSGSPFSWMAGELFKIKNGKIRQIEIVIVKVPYRMPSGWPPMK